MILSVFALLHSILLVHASQCQPFKTTFPASSVGHAPSSQFISITPEHSYQAGDGGLELFIEKPEGTVTTRNGENSKVAEGATVNATDTML